MKGELIKISKEYELIKDKLLYLDKLSLTQQNLDNMDMPYSYRLFITKQYWEEQLKNSL